MAPIESDRLPRKRPGVNNLCSQQPHKIALDDLCAQLNLRDIRAGLTTTQVNEAQNNYGLNELAPAPHPGFIRLFFLQTFTGFNALLWIAAIFAFLAYNPFGDPQPDLAK